jgi:hypothetical protein
MQTQDIIFPSAENGSFKNKMQKQQMKIRNLNKTNKTECKTKFRNKLKDYIKNNKKGSMNYKIKGKV